MNRKEEYFQKQLTGLILILLDGQKQDNFVARDYVIEKLGMIKGNGINFHPIIKKALGLL